jgi:2-methylaconitate cis-trans-isomerase PrpF
MVIPKPVLLAPASAGGTLSVRYFMPHECHRALAITGAIAVATACATPGTVAAALAGPVAPPAEIVLEHPSGRLGVRLVPRACGGAPAAIVERTARRLFEGVVFARAADLRPAATAPPIVQHRAA